MTDEEMDDEVIEDYEIRIKLMVEAERSRRLIEKHKWERLASVVRELLVIVENEANR